MCLQCWSLPEFQTLKYLYPVINSNLSHHHLFLELFCKTFHWSVCFSSSLLQLILHSAARVIFLKCAIPPSTSNTPMVSPCNQNKTKAALGSQAPYVISPSLLHLSLCFLFFYHALVKVVFFLYHEYTKLFQGLCTRWSFPATIASMSCRSWCKRHLRGGFPNHLS